ncbi:hypothetical protein ACJ72_08329 [Emergomyces africanus]|uniref:BZIP domain-containing protein n=1 Tax=Emergomyces africanus TaxID=1955775 RepID=A0A1B7NKR5_9EURO|nr:hypothetical protein ACJ72_08329 [Emergomyces africanus]
MSRDDNPQLNHHLPSASLGQPLSSEGVVSQAQTATTVLSSPWLNFIELNHDLSPNDQSLGSSQLPGTSLQTESASTLSNPLADAPVSAAFSQYDLLHPYPKGHELEVDDPLYLMNVLDSFETSMQPVTQYHHTSTSQNINTQDINRPQPRQSSIPPQSQLILSSPQLSNLMTTISPTDASANNGLSTPSSTQTPRSLAEVTAAPSTDRVADKRRRNTLAARRFRQKQHDRVAELERALESVCKERDELKMQAARWEGEVVALRGMLQKKKK